MGGIASFCTASSSTRCSSATYLYAIAFVGNLPAPKTIDSGAVGPLPLALAIDTVLLGLFAVQHSVMARPAFKRWWTRLVPEPVERTTFVLFASLALLLLYWQWRPMPDRCGRSPTRSACRAQAIFWIGWALVLLSTFMINHFELFGLRQVYAGCAARALPSAASDAVPLQAGAPSALSRLPARLLGDAGT
jgi:protein-S-isoprenylcysteine O-methyltransferase Ste14